MSFFKFSLISFVALTPLSSLSASTLETTLVWDVGKDRVLFKESVSATDTGFSAVLTTSAGEYDALDMDRNRSTLRWSRRDSVEDTQVTAERVGSKVRVRGTFRGKPYDKTEEIGDLPWYQLHEISYENLFLTGDASAKFWTIDRKRLKPREFKAERVGDEAIEVMGGNIEAIKYSLTIHGVPGFLFTSHFWLRKTDGRFLKLEAPAILGYPRSTVELTGES